MYKTLASYSNITLNYALQIGVLQESGQDFNLPNSAALLQNLRNWCSLDKHLLFP